MKYKHTEKEIVERLVERLEFHSGNIDGYLNGEHWIFDPVDVMKYAAKDIVDCLHDRVFEGQHEKLRKKYLRRMKRINTKEQNSF